MVVPESMIKHLADVNRSHQNVVRHDKYRFGSQTSKYFVPSLAANAEDPHAPHKCSITFSGEYT